MNKRQRSKIAALSTAVFVLSFAGCGDDEAPPVRGSGSIPINTNRQPAPYYSQGTLAIPGALNDLYLSTNASWAGSAGPLHYLWSLEDLSVASLYPQLTLPQSELIVAVIDTGVDYTHDDLLGRLWVNPGEYGVSKFDNRVDDDGNGFADDFLGWDYVNDMNNPVDDSGHGTHVAGTIAALGGNGLGISGVAPWVRIMALKACDSNGSCSSSDIRAAISYAVAHGAKIINLSIGALDTGPDSVAFDHAIADATNAGALVLVAAGNSGTNTEYMSPANATYAVAVAAHRNDGNVCSFSDYGWKVDVSAPGCGYNGFGEVSGILSLNSKRCGSSGDQYCTTGSKAVGSAYALKSGTSMSSPHAAGMAAVAWTASPDATPLQIRQALMRTARKPFAGEVDIDFGMGKLSGTNLIAEAQTAPGIKIFSPHYGTIANSHSISFKIESRANAVSWALRYHATNIADADVPLSSGTLIAASATDVPSSSSVTLTQAWAPPAAGEYLVILEATASGQKYYDVTVLRR